MATTGLRPVNLWALILLVVALLGSAGFIVYGVRFRLPSMLILAVVGAIFNVLLLFCVLAPPLFANRELRGAYFFFFLQNWLFIAGALAVAHDSYQTAAVAVIGGGVMYFLITRKRFSRLRRLRDKPSDHRQH